MPIAMPVAPHTPPHNSSGAIGAATRRRADGTSSARLDRYGLPRLGALHRAIAEDRSRRKLLLCPQASRAKRPQRPVVNPHLSLLIRRCHRVLLQVEVGTIFGQSAGRDHDSKPTKPRHRPETALSRWTPDSNRRPLPASLWPGMGLAQSPAMVDRADTLNRQPSGHLVPRGPSAATCRRRPRHRCGTASCP